MMEIPIILVIAVLAILIILIVKITTLGDKVRTLEWYMQSVRKTLEQRQEADSPPPSPQVRQPAPALVEPPREKQAIPPVSPIPTPAPSRTRAEFESFVGGKLLNRIGALALVIGIGFFLKYAFDNEWITESMRVVIGCVAGIGLLALGVRTHKKEFAIFAQGLFGAGISTLYLSVYASFNFYLLVPQPVAFGLMSLVTVLGFTVAIRYDSLAIALLAWAGGFLTPFLLSTGTANETGLFTYIALLEAGLLALVARRPSWSLLGPLTLAGTYIVYVLWWVDLYTEEDFALTVCFLTLFWGLLFLSELHQSLRRRSTELPLRQVMSFFNIGVYYGALYFLVDPVHHDWMGAASLALALVYLVQVMVLRRSDGGSAIVAQNIFITLMLVVFATAIQCTGYTTVQLWAIEAVLFIWCARRWRLQYVVFFAVGLLACAALKLAFTIGAFNYVPLTEFMPVLNIRAASFISLFASFVLCALLLRGIPEKVTSAIATILYPAAAVLLLALVTVETNDAFMQRLAGASSTGEEYIYFAKFMAIASVWIVTSLPIAYLGLKHRLQPVLIPGLFIAVLAFWLVLVKGIAYAPLDSYSPFFNVRASSFAVVIGGMALLAIWLRTNEPLLDWLPDAAAGVAIAAVFLLLGMLTAETRDIFEQQLYRAGQLSPDASEEFSRLENLKQLSLSGLWMVYGGVLMGIGIWRRSRGVRMLSIALLGIAILKIFAYDLSFLDALYRIFSFIGLGLILLAASYFYQKYKSIILGDGGSAG